MNQVVKQNVYGIHKNNLIQLLHFSLKDIFFNPRVDVRKLQNSKQFYLKSIFIPSEALKVGT